MPRPVRNILSIALALVVIATGGLQSARAVFKSTVTVVHASHGMNAEHHTAPPPHAHHDHAAVLPVNPTECLIVCLKALPDHYLKGQEFRVPSCEDATSYPYPDKVAPNWLTLNQLQSLHLAARGPPCKVWIPNLSGAQQVFLRTHRLRI
mgnify:FL=1